MSKRIKTPSSADVVRRVAADLVPLYSAVEADRPDSMLAGYPRRTRIIDAQQTLLDTMFPGRFSDAEISCKELPHFLARSLTRARKILREEITRALPLRWRGQAARTEGAPKTFDASTEAMRVTDTFLAALPRVRWLLIEDVKAAYDGDPAALTYAEVQIAYPGLLAIASHRIAHELYKLDVPLVPRVMSEWTHAQTGADIHPGAQIGHGFFIDHATGVVIGETTQIGNRVKLYQGVTLGARSFPLDENGNPIKHVKRHPTVEDEVVIYANATILGGDTIIGPKSTIGGNVFLLESVPANSFVAAKHPELRIKRAGQRIGC